MGNGNQGKEEGVKKPDIVCCSSLDTLLSEEHQMIPDFRYCKLIRGNLCCWDKERNEFFIIEQKRILDPSLYKEAVAAFINDNLKEKGGD